MTRARVVIELPEGQRVSDFERDLDIRTRMARIGGKRVAVYSLPR